MRIKDFFKHVGSHDECRRVCNTCEVMRDAKRDYARRTKD